MDKTTEVKAILTKQMEERQAFLAENLSETMQADRVQVHINGGNNKLYSKSVPKGIEKRTFEILDIDTLKKIAGTPDEFHQMDLMDWNLEIKGLEGNPEWESFKDLNNREQNLACKLMTQYVYGDSSKVSQYKDLLSQLYFPMSVSYFGNGETDIVVEENTDFEIGDYGETTVFTCNSITLKKVQDCQ